MSERKRTFKYFTIMEYEEEQEYLRSEHKRGWRFLDVIFPGIYTFERCEPEDVVYQLDYNKEGRKYMAEYTQMFRDSGWEHICDFVGYSYFRKAVSEMKEEEEIFNDDSSKLDMLRRVFYGRMVPLLVIFVLIICPQLYVQLSFGTIVGISCFLMYAALLLIYLIVFIKCALKYHDLKKKVR